MDTYIKWNAKEGRMEKEEEEWELKGEEDEWGRGSMRKRRNRRKK